MDYVEKKIVTDFQILNLLLFAKQELHVNFMGQ